jgi:NAD(P)H-flavin reductase
MNEPLNPDLTLRLRVQDAQMMAQDIRQFTLVEADGGELPEFTPGSHILIQAPSGATRRYSLSSAPQDRDHYTIAVKREPDGRGGSISMVDDIQAGDVLFASPPRNEFELKENAPGYTFIAGGIGITPVRSMIHHLVNTSDRPWKLYYLCRDPSMTAYREELAAPEFRGKVVDPKTAEVSYAWDFAPQYWTHCPEFWDMKAWRDKFKSKFNADVQIYAPYVYDAVNVMVAAMVKAGSADPKVYLPVLAKTDGYKGVTGTIAFDEKGDIKNGALTLYTYKGGAREQLAVVR